MRKIFLLFVAMFVTNIVFAGNFEITGYKTGMYILSDVQEDQLNKNVITKISEELTVCQNKVGAKNRIETMITIIGHSDRTGSQIENQDLSQKRAEQIKKRLNGKFSNVMITDYSEGDKKDVKKVVVNWDFKITPIVNQESNKQGDKKYEFLQMIILIIAAVVLAGGAVFYALHAKTKKLPGPEIVNEIIKEKQSSYDEILTIKYNGKSWDLDVSVVGGFYKLPLRNKNRQDLFLSKPNGKKARDEFRQCLGDPDYQNQINELRKNNKLRVTNIEREV
jgi:hypothetical protein